MGGTWGLGTISGIRIRLHWTFLLLPLYVYWTSINQGLGTAAALNSVFVVLTIFGCVLLHELGHALAARQFGIATRDITLLPIGGVAALERMPRNPGQEFWIAIAGPLVNVVIATCLSLGFFIQWAGGGSAISSFWFQIIIANVVLVVFNLLPAFPMDGGRVLRSFLTLVLDDYRRATAIAVQVGQWAAICLGLAGLWGGQIGLVLVALFVYWAARAEGIQVRRPLASEGGDPFASFSRWGRGGGAYRVDTSGNWQGFPVNHGRAATGGYGSPGEEFNESHGTAGDNNRGHQGEGETIPASLTTYGAAAWMDSRQQDQCWVVEQGRPARRVTRGELLLALSRGLGSQPIGSVFT